MGNIIEDFEASKVCISVLQYGDHNEVDTTYIFEDFIPLDAEWSYSDIEQLRDDLDEFLKKVRDSEKE